MSKNFHESFREEKLELPSDRSTGLVFAAVGVIVALIWRANPTVLWSGLGAAAGFAAVSLAWPALLRPLNIVWMRFAVLLNRIMSPVIMLVLFCVAIVPFGLAMQLKRDPLRRKRGTGDTYWRDRTQDEAPVSSMKNQF